jgi:hypothetical protein
MLQQSHRLLLNELSHHVAQDGSYRVESFVCSAYVGKTDVVQQNLLHNEDRHSLAQFGTSLHDPKAKRDDLGGKEEVDHIRRVVLDKRTNHAKGSQAQIFEGARLGSGVEERVKEKRNMSYVHKYQHPILRQAYELKIITYRSETASACHCEKRHTAATLGHCRPG